MGLEALREDQRYDPSLGFVYMAGVGLSTGP
jgi:hypothetical protein